MELGTWKMEHFIKRYGAGWTKALSDKKPQKINT